jgi:Cdc25 family phosphatase
MHFPSVSLDATMPTLLRKLADKETVVFHCALSQQRGPGAALQYLREREAAAADAAGQKTGGAVEGEKGNGDGARVVKGTEVKPQKVYVLDRGFVGWQEVYGLDERLTDAYRKELWEQGY